MKLKFNAVVVYGNVHDYQQKAIVFQYLFKCLRTVLVAFMLADA